MSQKYVKLTLEYALKYVIYSLATIMFCLSFGVISLINPFMLSAGILLIEIGSRMSARYFMKREGEDGDRESY